MGIRPCRGEAAGCPAEDEALFGRRNWAKTQNGVFEFFGDLSEASSIVFYELHMVLIPEFGDLIPEIGGSDPKSGSRFLKLG